jgi:hypothetical protein
VAITIVKLLVFFVAIDFATKEIVPLENGVITTEIL